MSAVPNPLSAANDPDEQETQEWLDALEVVLEREGRHRAQFLLEQLVDQARRVRRLSAVLGQHRLPEHDPWLQLEEHCPVTPRIERAHRGLHPLERDGHGRAGQPAERRTRRPHRQLSRRQRRCTRSASITSGGRRRQAFGGDLVYIQGHSSPGIYARAYLEGRLTEEQLDISGRKSTARAGLRPIRIRG